jgi:thymidine phosphorylase
MLVLAGLAGTLGEAEPKVRMALASGQALEKFRALVARQGGAAAVIDDPTRLPTAPRRALVRAPRAGYVVELDAELVGRGTMLLGAGRDRVEDVIDPSVGAVVLAKPGDEVRAGDGVIEVHYRGEARLGVALPLLERALVVGDAPPPAAPLIFETLG